MGANYIFAALDVAVVIAAVIFILINKIKTRNILLLGSFFLLVPALLSFFSEMIVSFGVLPAWVPILFFSTGYILMFFGFKGGVQ